jgi:hypothetical protein
VPINCGSRENIFRDHDEEGLQALLKPH